MSRNQAKDIARELNARGGPVTYKPARQDWRAGNHWWVKGSDGSGVFLAGNETPTPPQHGAGNGEKHGG